MSKIIYICENITSGSTKYLGVQQKVEGQISAFQSAGFECDLIYLSEQHFLDKVLLRLPFTSAFEKWPEIRDINKFDCVYLRKPKITKGFLKFLKSIRNSSPHIKILLELPTYPYDDEMKKIQSWPLLIKERHNRRKLVGLVDYIVDLSGHQTIFGLPTIQMRNGISMSQVLPRKPSGAASKNQAVHILMVATFATWHGADRAIEGLAAYVKEGRKKERPVFLHLVGDGTEVPKLENLANKHGLSDVVIFEGRCERKQMDAIYDQCSLAIASLGLHRIGIQSASTLKTREYLAKGMPFVYAGEIDIFTEKPIEWCLEIPANEEPVDFHDLIAFHDHLYLQYSEEGLISIIRSYAEETIEWKTTMNEVINYLSEI